MAEESYFRTYGAYNDNLEEGSRLALDRRVQFDYFRRTVPEMAELVKLTPDELTKRREASAQLEQDIFAKIQSHIKEWEKQAGQTLLLDKALEYLQTPEVEHTSNEWKHRLDGSWEISNLVYKMIYTIWEDPAGDKKGTWLVSWSLAMNRPVRPPSERLHYAGDPNVASQSKKRYPTFEAAQNYIQGRFDLYAPLFTELRPPIPDKFKGIFHINGWLLPGYEIEAPEKTEPDKGTVDALLDCLTDEDTAIGEGPAPATQSQGPAQPSPTPKAEKADKPSAPPEQNPARKKPPKGSRKKKRAAPER